MRDTLMIEAFCWDTESMVIAKDVHGMEDLSIYCPHSECLAEVIAKYGGKNFYFAAPAKHASGCPNEPPEVKNKNTTTVPNRKSSAIPEIPTPIPTELGPAQRPKKKKNKPTRAELLALVGSLKNQQPRRAGTLEEVISARQAMSWSAREKYQLLIRGEKLSYTSGFYFLGGANTVSEIPFGTRVVHGAVTVSYQEKEKCFWVTSLKKFETPDGEKTSLKLRVSEMSPAGGYIKQLIPAFNGEHKCSLFYSGVAPKLSSSGKSYLLSEDIANEYWRFALLVN